MSDGHLRRAAIRLPEGDMREAISFRVRLIAADGGAIEELGPSPAMAFLQARITPLHPVRAASLPPARYDAAEMEALRDLRRLLRSAVRTGDAKLSGQVATDSARIQQRRLPKPHFDILLNVAATHDAVGIGVAPDAGGVALIFDAQKRGLQLAMHRAARDLRFFGFIAPP
jgi:uncharacterized protein involved in propanediol utilization